MVMAERSKCHTSQKLVQWKENDWMNYTYTLPAGMSFVLLGVYSFHFRENHPGSKCGDCNIRKQTASPKHFVQPV